MRIPLIHLAFWCIRWMSIGADERVVDNVSTFGSVPETEPDLSWPDGYIDSSGYALRETTPIESLLAERGWTDEPLPVTSEPLPASDVCWAATTPCTNPGHKESDEKSAPPKAATLYHPSSHSPGPSAAESHLTTHPSFHTNPPRPPHQSLTHTPSHASVSNAHHPSGPVSSHHQSTPRSTHKSTHHSSAHKSSHRTDFGHLLSGLHHKISYTTTAAPHKSDDWTPLVTATAGLGSGAISGQPWVSELSNTLGAIPTSGSLCWDENANHHGCIVQSF
jgi:hypothetical protein